MRGPTGLKLWTFGPSSAALKRELIQRWHDDRTADGAASRFGEADRMRREPMERPRRGRPDLAMSLNNQSLLLAKLARPEEALAAIEEATAIYRQPAAARPLVFQHKLADSLDGMVAQLSALGRNTEAEAARNERLLADRQQVLGPGHPVTLTTRRNPESLAGQGWGMAAVMIGVDPHKGSHTAVAIGAAEQLLGELRVRTCAAQGQRLLAWPRRIWAIEGAGGLGHLLAQQLLAAGERVVDVPPKLGARVRLLGVGAVNKNDPNDARSVAVAALRSPARREVRPDDHAAVLKVWAKRHRDLGRARTQVACRLHAVLCELVAGGVSKRISPAAAGQLLAGIRPAGAVDAARCELAAEFLADLRRIDAQMREAKKKLTVAVRASGTP
jgi:hypothetical protein